MGPGKHALDGGAHWCNLANRTEPSLCGGDAASCPITLTTCLYIPYALDIYKTLGYAQGPNSVLRQSKYCQLLHNCTRKSDFKKL